MKTLTKLATAANRNLKAIAPKGHSRSPIVRVDYCARGKFEALCADGSCDYVRMDTVRKWAAGVA